MKVVCQTNIPRNIEDECIRSFLLKYYGSLDYEPRLEIGREYTVHGIVFWDNCPFYYVYQDEDLDYPVPIAYYFFEVSDERVSSYWKVGSFLSENGQFNTLIAFKEWAENQILYEHLIDEKEYAKKLFTHYRKIIEKEFSPRSYTQGEQVIMAGHIREKSIPNSTDIIAAFGCDYNFDKSFSIENYFFVDANNKKLRISFGHLDNTVSIYLEEEQGFLFKFDSDLLKTASIDEERQVLRICLKSGDAFEQNIAVSIWPIFKISIN